MKLRFLFLTLLLAGASAHTHAQVIYNEDFETPAIQPPNYFAQLPAGFVTYTDSNTLGFTNMPYSDPWLMWKGNPEQAAVCPTYFTPSATADRWMITPTITLTNNNFLVWKSRTYWNQIPELYEVKLSTTGTAKTDFTVNLATINNDSDVYTMHSINLSAFAGQPVHIAFRMRSTYGWYFYMDEIRVEDNTANDGAVIGSGFHSYETMGALPVVFRFFNNSPNAINALQLNYAVDNGPVQTQALSSLNIAAFDTQLFTHSISWTPSSTGMHTVKMWTSAINNGTDVRPANDTLIVPVGIVSQVAPKNVMVEEHTGAWCGYCVDGNYHLESLDNAYPWVIPYAIHEGDAMSFPYGDSININVYAYPSGFFDRYDYENTTGWWGTPDRTLWQPYTLERYANGTPCAVQINHTYNASTRQLSATVQSTFYGDFSREFRMNLFVIEDSVTGGTGPMWDQHNYYSSQSSAYGGPSHPYYNLPDPIVGFKHRHVCRAMLGGPWGQANSIPLSVTDGGVYTWTFNYTLPANFNANRVSLAGMVMGFAPYYRNRPIVNAIETPLIAPNGIAENENGASLEVFPNPSSGGMCYAAIGLTEVSDVQLQVFDISGKNVWTDQQHALSAGQHLLPLGTKDLSPGMYLLTLRVGENVLTKKIIVQ